MLSKYVKYILIILLDVFVILAVCYAISNDGGFQKSEDAIPVFSDDENAVTEHSEEDISSLNDIFEQNIVTINSIDFEMSEENRIIIESLIDNYENKFAFYAVTLDKSMSFGYNPDDVFHSSGMVKAPFVLYCFKQIAERNKHLGDTKVYESRFYRGGSGVLQDKPFGGAYSVEDLLFLVIHYDDNIAYQMLSEHFGKGGYNDFINELGCANLRLSNDRNQSEASPRDAFIAWKNIYDFNLQSEEGKMCWNLLLNARQNFIQDALPEYSSAHKSDWSGVSYHDTGIVFGDCPYYIAVMTNSPGNADDQAFVKKIFRAIDDVVNEYNSYKSEETE